VYAYACSLYPDLSEEQASSEKYCSRWGLLETKQQWFDFVKDFVNSEYFLNIKPINGVVKALRTLKADGHNISVLSSVGTYATARRIENFRRICPVPVLDNLVCIDPAQSKKEQLEQMKADVFVDDGLTYIADSLEVDSVKLRMLFACPMNKEFIAAMHAGHQTEVAAATPIFKPVDLQAVKKGAKVVHTWPEIVEQIRTLARGH
jgi:hypothetical protein